jgi:hypothetical protein
LLQKWFVQLCSWLIQAWKIFCFESRKKQRRLDDNDSHRIGYKDGTDRLFGLRPVEKPGTPASLGPSPKPPAQRESPVDIIFVHGLGGSARKTWTDSGGSNRFWPQWLYRYKGMEGIRIYTFGYNADWEKVWAPRNALGIPEFALQLLDGLRLHYNQNGDVLPHLVTN